MDLDHRIVDEIVARITRVARSECIILFGSAATGRMTSDSDLDLLVVQREVADPRAESRRVREALAGIRIPGRRDRDAE